MSEMLDQVPWLPVALGAYLDVDALRTSLSTIPPEYPSFRPGVSDLAAAVYPIAPFDKTSGLSAGLPEDRVFRAVLLMGYMAADRQGSLVSRRDIDLLAQALSRSSAYRGEVEVAAHAVVAGEPVEESLFRLLSELESSSYDDTDPLFASLKGPWYRLSRSFESIGDCPLPDLKPRPKASTPSGLAGKKAKPPKSRRRKSDLPRLTLQPPPGFLNEKGKFDFSKMDVPGSSEPKSESAIPVFSGVIRMPSDDELDIDEDEPRGISWSPHGSANALLSEHASVLLPWEARLLCRCVVGRIEEDLKAFDYSSACVGLLILVSLATGLNVKAMRRVPIGRGIQEIALGPSIDYQSGIICRPLLQIGGGGLVEWTGELPLGNDRWFLEELPPSLTDLLRRAWSRVENYQGQFTKEKLHSYLSTFESLSHATRYSGRIRMFAPVAKHAISQDFAVTMLTTADKFRRAATPLHYVNQSHCHLQDICRRAIWPIFGDTVPDRPDSESDEAPIGNAHIASPETARTLVRDVEKRVPSTFKFSEGQDSSEVSRNFNLLVDRILAHVMHITLHRPTKPLFQLRRFDFDLLNLIAIVFDKRSDLAHAFRLVCITKALSDSIGNYLQVLWQLIDASIIPDATKIYLAGVIYGKNPMFFHLNESLLVREMEIEDWSPSWPTSWTRYPSHWYRAFAATRLRNLGAPPLAVNVQMGHLEAAEYPLARDSTIAPLEIADVLRPFLKIMEHELGWAAWRGFRNVPTAEIPLPPLAMWDGCIVSHNKLMNELASATKRETSPRSRKNMAQGWTVAAKTLALKCPALAKFLGDPNPGGRPKRYEGRFKGMLKDLSASGPRALTEETLAAIEAEIDADKKNTPAIRAAARYALSFFLRHATKLGWAVATPRLFGEPSRPDPTPVFSGLMAASMSVDCLRERALQLPTAEPFDAAYAKLALILALFSAADSVERIHQIIQVPRSSISRLKNIGDAVLVEIEHGVFRLTYALRGVASIAFAAFRARFESDIANRSPTNQALDTILYSSLSGGDIRTDLFLDGSHSLLERIVSICRANALIEQSPLARYAYGMDGGRSVILAQQQHLFDGLAADSNTASDEKDSEISDQPLVPESSCHELTRVLLEQNYSQLLADISQEDHETRSAYLRRVIPDLRKKISDNAYLPVVNWLAFYAWTLITKNTYGASKDRKIAEATVKKYLGGIARPLIRRLSSSSGALDLTALSVEEHADLYHSILKARLLKGRSTESGMANCADAAMALMSLHDILVVHADVLPVDRKEFEEYRQMKSRGIDAALIPDEQIWAIHAVLTNSLSFNDDNPSSLTLDDRANLVDARACLILLEASGARLSEIVMLRLCDVITAGSFIAILLRPTRFKIQKTRKGRRLKVISKTLSEEDRQFISKWFEQKKNAAGPNVNETLPLFGCRGVQSIASTANRLRRVLQMASAMAGWGHLILHRLRHNRISHDLMSVFTVQRFADVRTVHSVRHSNAVVQDHNLSRLRKARELAVSMGHRHLTTTIRSYFHLQWMLVNHAAALSARAMCPGALAAASNFDAATLHSKGAKRVKRNLIDGYSQKSKSFGSAALVSAL